MTGSFGEMGSLLKQAQEMQRELDRVRNELRTRTFEGSAGGGVVKVWVTGDRQVTKVEIAKEVIQDGDKALIEEMLLAALRDGIGKATRLAEESLSKVTGGISLGGALTLQAVTTGRLEMNGPITGAQAAIIGRIAPPCRRDQSVPPRVGGGRRVAG